MKNPTATVKEAYANHKTKLVYGAGVATGIAVVVCMKRTFPTIPLIQAVIEPEQLQTVIDDPTAVMNYIDKHAIVLFTNSTNPDLK